MSFDRVSDAYDETRIIPDGVLSEFYSKIAAAGTILNQNSLVLDAGIGTGRTTGPLSDLGVQLIGVDISKKMVKKMIKRMKGSLVLNRASLILGDVTALPFRTDSVDLIISVHVLHLVKKWRKAIGEAKRVLRPEGFFAVATHGAPDLVSKVGQKYFSLCDKYGIPQAKGMRGRISRLMNRLLYHRRMRFLERFSQIILEHNSFLGIGGELHMRKQAVTMKQYTIRWKETLNINEIFNRLNNRIISKQWRIPDAIHRKIISELAKWKTKEIEENGSLEKVAREFKMFLIQFK